MRPFKRKRYEEQNDYTSYIATRYSLIYLPFRQSFHSLFKCTSINKLATTRDLCYATHPPIPILLLSLLPSNFILTAMRTAAMVFLLALIFAISTELAVSSRGPCRKRPDPGPGGCLYPGCPPASLMSEPCPPPPSVEANGKQQHRKSKNSTVMGCK